MEGLLLARALQDLAPQLPRRTLGWVFPDEVTACVLLEGIGNLVLNYRPPHPTLYISPERLSGEPVNAFQRTLAARARGELVHAEQLKLDRVVRLHFSGERGFVDVPPARLVFELAGRNANVLLLDDGEGWQGTIVATAREVTGARNRFRTVRTGGVYRPPPPYEKLDPRTATPQELGALADVPVGRWRDHVDGLGPVLTAELARRSGLGASEVPGERTPQVQAALGSLIQDPTVTEGTVSETSREAARAEKAEVLRKALREPLIKRRTLLQNQLGDVARALEAADAAQSLRRDADLLMAYPHLVPAGSESARLPDFSGEGTVEVALEPQLSAIQNAERIYGRARRREEVAERLIEREPLLRAELAEVEAQLARLELTELGELERLERELPTDRNEKPAFGWRYLSPSGYEVLVGRNNKENDVLTHRVGRSTDYWFHAQGYPGSHVLVRTGGKELPVPDILMAASLAAYHSKARASGNVPVDYTRVKHVWKPRGAAAGKVLYTQQKTVFVDPALPQEG